MSRFKGTKQIEFQFNALLCIFLKFGDGDKVLKDTGEVYFINWRTGMKSQEDPRINPDINCEFYNSEEDDSCYDSEGSSSESSSREQEQYKTTAESNINERAQVLVAAGCKSCLMYFMVPKQAEDCPKCYGQLLHFDRSENTSP
ncbi:hypothetical protein M9H77_10380 [Catharanthus roseus]|uniref:Uncharacterized protein n=1 Tax=Catharanthus roseus TaxID=4058 RepID=A0ACC0C3B6_CATRO|nr:hypothetical protein M9H77_10380 [Catharanthus roseus]